MRRIVRSELFHGGRKKKDFFEGWYFKLVSADKTNSIALIPGISKVGDVEDSHSFVQVLRETDETHYIRFETADFSWSDNPFNVRVANSSFDLGRISVDVHSEKLDLSGEIHFSCLHRWPSTILSPGAMGWFSYVPFMQCYHGILSMDHELSGYLCIQGKEIDFTGGRGYIEKDWGRSFPSAWIWMQTNHFSVPGTSLTLSIATVPWLGRPFTGMIGGFLHDGVLERFTTYTGAKIDELETMDDTVRIRLKKKDLTLLIEAQRRDGGILKSPLMGSMSGRIKESLSAEIKVQFMHEDRVVFDGVGTNAGLEVVGAADGL